MIAREEAQRLLDSVELHRALGLDLIELDERRALFSFAPPPLARERQSNGVHGGAIAAALDTAACFALIARVGADCSTLDLRVDYLRPALDDAFEVVGEVVRAGKRFGWAQATLRTLAGRDVASARGAFAWSPPVDVGGDAG